ncbi:hypothetical protein [Enterovirga sp. CN4-39]
MISTFWLLIAGVILLAVEWFAREIQAAPLIADLDADESLQR